ncbi:uncharacterized protein [Typha latifolia]|uniref:uncharacterized protein n=1 Tax=Typha latifolia TaxID=4733 RepID=UPI003C2FDBBD
MGDSESPPNPNSKKPSLCEECGENSWKYRCPGCSILTCSLPCVRSHKERTSCTGKRNRTEFVPLSRFDDNLLLSDYNLLEETKRIEESARRLIAGFGGNVGPNLPMRLRMLRQAAYRRRTQLFFLPRGMSKREKNLSLFNTRKKCIYWTLEWRFHSTDVILIDHNVDEYANLSSLIEKHLVPGPWNDQLTTYRNAPLDGLKLFIRKNAKGAKSPYRELNISSPIGPQLKNVLIIEYPVIHVFLPSDSYDFEVEKDVNLFVKNEKPPELSAGEPTPKGTIFKVEEIEEGEMTSETQVMDLVDNSAKCNKGTYQPGRQILRSVAGGLKTNSNKAHKKVLEDNNRHYRSNVNSRRFPYHENFNYDHESKGCFSDPRNTTRLSEDSVSHERETDYLGTQMVKVVAEGPKATPDEKYQMNVLVESNSHSSANLNSDKFPEEENFDFEQEVKDAYSDLLGEMNPDDFLCLDGGFGNEDESEERSNLMDFDGMFLREDELEEGEIPSFLI